MFTIKSVVGCIHDLGFGGYPYKVIATIEIRAESYKKLKGDLGSLVLDVNNALYRLNRDIPAHNPSIDSQGHRRAKNGVKTMEFEYLFQDHARAEALGYKLLKLRNGEVLPEYNQYVKIALDASVGGK